MCCGRGVTQWCRAPPTVAMTALRGYTVDWPHSQTALATCTESTSAPPTLNGTIELYPLWPWETCLSWISNLYVNSNKTVVVGWRKKYHKTWCCEWQVWPGHSLTMAIGVTYKAIRLMVILVLEEVTLKSWRGINFEKTAREYKRRSEINPEQLWLGFRDGFGSDDLLIFLPIVLLVLLWYWHCNCIKMVEKKKKKKDEKN